MALLLDLARRVPYRSEDEQAQTLDLLRAVESDLGTEGIVPPPRGPTNAPGTEAPRVEPPGPVAEPVPPDEQPPPPVGTEAAVADPVAPEATNAFNT